MGIDLEGWCVSSSERMMRYQHSVRSWLGMLVVLSLLAGSMPSVAQDPADSAEEGAAAAGGEPKAVPASTEPVYDEDIAPLSKEFDEIQDFMLDTDGMYETVDTASQCRLKCTENAKCRSYSFSVKGNDKQPGPVCVITKKFVGFDPNWKFYTKTMAVDAFGKLRLMGRFKSFEGMRYIDENHYRKVTMVTEEQCLEACEEPAPEGPECRAFSYNRDKQICLLTDDGLRYSAGFTYFERNKRLKTSGETKQYEHYELEESKDQAKARSVVERRERDAALKDKKIRLEREGKEDEIKTAKKEAMMKAAIIAKESRAKFFRQKEKQEKEDTRTRLQEKRDEAARLRGSYMESVAKAQVNVDERKTKVEKQKVARTKLAISKHRQKNKGETPS